MKKDEVLFRKAQMHEIEDIFGVLVKAFEPYRKRYSSGAFEATVLSVEALRSRMVGRDFEVFVVVFDGRVVGTVSVSKREEGRLHIRSMAVSPECQGRGFGLLMVEKVEEMAKRVGLKMLSLDTSKPLRKAIGFYQGCGFEFTGVVKDFFGVEIFEMVKRL